MISLHRIVRVVAVTLFLVGASQVATAGTAEASHCNGSTYAQVDYATNTVTSIWTNNPSLFNPPLCNQRAFAACSNYGFAVGPPTTLPWVEVSTVTCPEGRALGIGGSLVQHAD